MSAAPSASFSQAAGNGKAEVSGFYRMIDQPADSRVTPENILAPHRGRTLRRMQQAQTVLCIQDGSGLNFAAHGACQDLGLTGKNQGSEGTLGLHMHTMLVVDANGVPLGVPRIEFGPPEKNARDGEAGTPRKTLRWVRGLQECSALANRLDGVRPLSVMDREMDAVVKRRYPGSGRAQPQSGSPASEIARQGQGRPKGADVRQCAASRQTDWSRVDRNSKSSKERLQSRVSLYAKRQSDS